MYPVRISAELLMILTGCTSSPMLQQDFEIYRDCLLPHRQSRLYLGLYSHPIQWYVTCIVDMALLHILGHSLLSAVSCLLNTQHKMLLCCLLQKVPCTISAVIEHRTLGVVRGSWCSRLMKSSRHMTDQLSIILQSWLIKVCCVIHHREGKKF
jgi:hypothetical protein